MLSVRWMIYLFLAFGMSNIKADADLENPYYTTGLPSRDGIGKFYMGREISHVMVIWVRVGLSAQSESARSEQTF